MQTALPGPSFCLALEGVNTTARLQVLALAVKASSCTLRSATEVESSLTALSWCNSCPFAQKNSSWQEGWFVHKAPAPKEHTQLFFSEVRGYTEHMAEVVARRAARAAQPQQRKGAITVYGRPVFSNCFPQTGGQPSKSVPALRLQATFGCTYCGLAQGEKEHPSSPTKLASHPSRPRPLGRTHPNTSELGNSCMRRAPQFLYEYMSKAQAL